MSKYRVGLLADICQGKELEHPVLDNFSRSWELKEREIKGDLLVAWRNWHEQLTEEVCSVAKEYL